jgi:hypothetical protein
VRHPKLASLGFLYLVIKISSMSSIANIYRAKCQVYSGIRHYIV